MDRLPVLDMLFRTTTSNSKLIISLAPLGFELVMLPRKKVKAGLIVVSLMLWKSVRLREVNVNPSAEMKALLLLMIDLPEI